ncbi:hypothetical protein GG344DRAFT_73175 [Lentinula edodes]|nr:hypothetical protein GG344DRAFT_73175 [Lentinula edodes]
MAAVLSAQDDLYTIIMGLLGLILRILGLFSNHPRRLLLPYLLRHGFTLPGGLAHLLPDGTVVKVGNPAFLQLEAEATKYARDHTQLPIPRVYDFFLPLAMAIKVEGLVRSNHVIYSPVIAQYDLVGHRRDIGSETPPHS